MYFDRAFAPYLRDVPGRNLGHLNNYVSTLNTRRRILTDRYVRSFGAESQGIRLLRRIINRVDLSQAIKARSSLECYIKYIQPIEEDLRRMFDPAYGYNVPKNSFVTSRQSERIIEIITPMSMPAYPAHLPLSSFEWERWKDVRSLRMLANDSPELSFHLYTDRIVYGSKAPTYVVIGIDPVPLVLQYISYVRAYGAEKTISQTQYLSQNVVIPCLMTDIGNIWLRNTYATILKSLNTQSDVEDIKDIQSVWGGQLYGYLGSQFDNGMRDVARLVADTKKKAVRPEVLLTSLTGVTGNMVAILKDYRETCILDTGRQSYWVQFLKDMDWMSLVFRCVKFFRGNPVHRQFLLLLERDLALMKLSRFWVNIRNPHARIVVEERFHALMDELELEKA